MPYEPYDMTYGINTDKKYGPKFMNLYESHSILDNFCSTNAIKFNGTMGPDLKNCLNYTINLIEMFNVPWNTFSINRTVLIRMRSSYSSFNIMAFASSTVGWRRPQKFRTITQKLGTWNEIEPTWSSIVQVSHWSRQSRRLYVHHLWKCVHCVRDNSI